MAERAVIITDTVPKAKSKYRNAPGFPNVVGCTDGTFVRLQRPTANEGDFVNRRGYHSLNVQMCCGDAKFKITSCNASCPGSVHDSRIFRTSTLCRLFETGSTEEAGQRMTSQHFLPGKSLTGPWQAGKQDKVSPGEETDDQGVTLDILRVVKSISFKLTAPLDSCVESGVDYVREHLSNHDCHIVDSSNSSKKMVDVQPSSTEDDMSGCEFNPQVPGVNRGEDGVQTSPLSQTSHPHLNSADKSQFSSVNSVMQMNTKSGKKTNVSKTYVLSESEDEDPPVSVKPVSGSPARSSPSRLSLGIQSEPANNQQLITCFDSMNSVDGDAVMNSDTRIHELNGDVSNFTLWLIKVPAEMSLMTLPKHITLAGVEDFAVDTKRYEVQAFDDDNLESDHVSLVQQDLNRLTEGPRFQGQIHIVRKPRDVLKPVTTAKIPHNAVPFPSGLKVRFKPFGAGEPLTKEAEKQKRKRGNGNDNLVMEELVPKRKKRGSADVVTPPKKKKKKRH